MNDSPTVRCDFLDVLEESVTIKKPVTVELKDGESFVDQVRNVITESGEDFVQFAEHGRVAVSRIARCEPSPDAHEHSYDPKL